MAVVLAKLFLLGAVLLAPTDKLSPGERVRVTVNDLMTPGKPTVLTVTVSEKGSVEMPYAGSVWIGGLTGAEAAAAIRKAYGDAKVLANANVKVERLGPATAPAEDAPKEKS